MTGDLLVGDLVLWWKTEPQVMGVVIEVCNSDAYAYPGIRVVWFGERGGPTVSACRKTDVSVLSRAKRETK